jgi:hypothetical protein
MGGPREPVVATTSGRLSAAAIATSSTPPRAAVVAASPTQPRSPAIAATTAGSTTAGSAAAGSAAAARVARADRTHEVPTPAPRQAVIGGWPTPIQAVEVFTTAYINWTAADVSARLRALAEVSVGQARSAMSLAAGETAQDSELQRGGIANSGLVEAIGPVRGRDDEYAVVTRELTTATNRSAYRGLEPAWHVSLATVTPIRGGLWVLSDWQPEN